MFEAGTLNEESIVEAIKDRELAFIHHALALLSKVPHEAVQKMMTTPSGKGVTALSYKAGLSMNTCEDLQMKITKVPPKQMIRAKRVGHYPMTEDDIDWYLDFYL